MLGDAQAGCKVVWHTNGRSNDPTSGERARFIKFGVVERHREEWKSTSMSIMSNWKQVIGGRKVTRSDANKHDIITWKLTQNKGTHSSKNTFVVDYNFHPDRTTPSRGNLGSPAT